MGVLANYKHSVTKLAIAEYRLREQEGKVLALSKLLIEINKGGEFPREMSEAVISIHLKALDDLQDLIKEVGETKAQIAFYEVYIGELISDQEA